MNRLWNALVAAAFNAMNNSMYRPLFALVDVLYRWALGASPALYADIISVANIAGTYANGTAGVGATYVKASAGAFPTTDDIVPYNGMLVLLTAQSTGYQNGLYKLTRVGDSSVAWQLTRFGGWDASAEMKNGSLFYVRQGTTYGGTVWANTTASAPTVGSTSLTFAQDSLLRAAVAATIAAVTSFAVGTLRVLNSAGTFAHTIASSATAARTVTLPDASFTVAQAAAQTGVPSATAAPTFTGTAPTSANADAFTGTGTSAAGQVITTTDNQTMTLNQCAGMWLIQATHGPVYIVSNTAVTGAPAVLTVLGIAATDAGVYKILRAPTPVGTVSAVGTATHTHAQT